MRYLPIILGVMIVALLAVLIFVPGPKAAEPLPSATSTATSTPNSTSTVNEPAGDPTPAGPSATLYEYKSSKNRVVRAYIAPNAKILSPITFTGNVPPGYAFEASFPVQLRDANGKVLGQGVATVPNWMSPSGAWYSVTISFTKPTTTSGYLVLHNDNPSGMPENDEEARIPVTF